MIKNMFKKKWCDRPDGWRVDGVDPVFKLMPYLQRSRMDGQCYFADTVDLDKIEPFIKAHREEIPGLSIMHIVLASIVRTISQRAYANRFIVNHKMYARNCIRVALMVKRTMDDKGEETSIMPEFHPLDTLQDVVARVNEEIFKNKGVPQEDNDFDGAAKLLGALPHFLIRLIAWYVRFSDNHGFLPKFIHVASPYHSSAFLTNVGSLGIEPIYHHLYEFGTCTFFIAMGKKHKAMSVDKDGTPVTLRTLGIKYVVDERVCDGHYNAGTIRYLHKLIENPEMLLTPPETVSIDDGVKRPLLNDPNQAR